MMEVRTINVQKPGQMPAPNQVYFDADSIHTHVMGSIAAASGLDKPNFSTALSSAASRCSATESWASINGRYCHRFLYSSCAWPEHILQA